MNGMMQELDRKFMEVAINEAKKSKARGDYAFGAAVAYGAELLAMGGNRVRTKNDSTKHVELEVIQYAVGQRMERYLTGCTLYTTCEPCLMCLGAAHWAGIARVVYGISQDDLAEHGKTHSTSAFRYRPSPISSRELIRQCPDTIHITLQQLMRDECIAILG
ncbi:nucleoside deaminase [Candidatus Jorgensenbacteria bacterium CG10_big_fil_rev_8_21_14_0_10_54_38]|uniref:Nucleoside deaminase n=2 Tax=Candidatus Joergenseniibacteriota TaxID=1752739 RepID=A0A2M6WG39_9BACT|nr:MAG: tRNA-specific adenosine deaminase [Candidatus Jorgensenbacteria bacterium CG23_combo_of_CG06-09_8_20_14_all_54_14]PIT91749.1 MAG: nucleoside deaminase [Candidatus Jorgensenbacteria bacterium CG10_big_fil_rev_8_21_14_0_10_54_38]